MSRRVRRSDDTTKTKQGYSTQREGEFSSRKTTRGTDNFFKSQPGKKDPYCVSYFRNNPDSMDMRTPNEKLQELNDRLDSELRGDINLQPADKFKTLTQIKSITYMINGEDSTEMLRAYANLGYFYNDNNRPQSAIRNLDKAHNLERTNVVDKDVSINIAIEMAKAQLSIKSHGTSASKQAALADDALSPYYDTEIEKVQLRYKRDLIRSRIFAAQKKYDEAIKSYEMSVKSLKELNENVETEDEANIFVEMAQTAEKKHKKMLASQEKSKSQSQAQVQEQDQTQTQDQIQDQPQDANQSENSEEPPPISREAAMFYHRAYDIYTKIGMEEKAKNIEPLLLNDDYSYYYYDEEEEEEEEATDTPASQEDNEQTKFAPREPDSGTGSRSSSRRRQFKEKQSEEADNENNDTNLLEKQQNDIIAGLVNNENEEENANEENAEEDKGENAKDNENIEEDIKENEEENVNEGNENTPNEAENTENNEEEGNDESVLNKKKNDIISGLIGGDEEKTDEKHNEEKTD